MIDLGNLLGEYNKALALYKSGQNDEALARVDELINLGTNWLKPYSLKGYILRALKRPVSELEVLQELLSLAEKRDVLSDDDRTTVADAWSMLGEVAVLLGESELAVEALLRSSELETDPAKKRTEYSNAIFVANYCPELTDNTWQELYTGHRKLFSDVEVFTASRNGTVRATAMNHQLQAKEPPVGTGCSCLAGDGCDHAQLGNEPPIRIGYLGADFREHPVAYFLRPLLEFHDREQFQVYIYQANEAEDYVTADFARWADVVRRVANLSDREIAAQIADDEIDILVDLSGHTKGNHLAVLAHKPARKHISAIGYFNSLGMFTDGFLSDVYCSPSRQHTAFSEPLLRLPHTHFCYQPWKTYPEIAETMPWEKNGYITFGCFNNFSKVTDNQLMLWQKIMAQVPNSHLILKHKLFDSEEGRQWTLDRLSRLGLAMERVELRGFLQDYLTQYNDMDIALDTYPYVGGLTSVETLLMGVPLVTKYGSRHGTRFGLSFLSNIDMAELACSTDEEYIARAVALAGDRELLKLLHSKLPHMVQSSPLMDGRSYCREVEELYRQLFR